MKIFEFRGRSLCLNGRGLIMGILNVTPDSFSDGGRYLAPEEAIRHAAEMEKDGADIIDVGAVSTRPGADVTDAAEEWERLKNVLPAVKKNCRLPVSVDTFRVETAERCLEAGADIINDVSGVYRRDMADAVKKYDAGWVLMHGGVLLHGAADEVDYPVGVVNDVQRFFDEVAVNAAADGIDVSRLCVDPGFGFAKNTVQNAELLRCFDLLDPNGMALLCALSRKRFIGALSEDTSVERLGGTLAANVSALIKGADIIRVHEIKEHSAAVKLLHGAEIR